MSMPVIPYSFPPYLTEDQQQQQQSATAYPGSQFLLQTLPPPPAPPNPVSSPIMLEQLNSSSKPDQRRGGPVTYRRLMPNGSGSPPVGNYTTNINEGMMTTSPVSSPGPSVSTSPLLPTESVNRSYMDSNGVTDQGQHPLAKLQNALDHGFLGIKLFSPVGNDARPPRENHRPSTGNDEYFGPPIPVALSVASRVSPDSYQNPDEVKDTRYRCHLCEFETGSNEEYTDHMNIHFDYKCTLCDYSSRTEGRLKRHLKDFHSEIPPESWAGTRVYRGSEGGASGGESNGSNPNSQSKQRNFNCKHCGHVSKTKKDFWVHIRVHIKSEKLLACPEPSCDFVTEYKHHFEYHIRIHTGSKPFKCDQCNYSCVNKSMLNSHKKSHSNIYQYRCKDCSYATKYCHSLKLHLRKYVHQPARVLNQDGTPNPYPIIDVYGNRRGPRPKRNKDDKNKPTGTKKVHSPSNSGIVSSSVSPNSQGSSDIRGIPSIGGGITQVPPPPPPPPLVVTTNPSWLYHSHLIASLNAGMFNSSSQLIPPELRHHEARHQLCPFCNYTTDDRELLSKHIMGHATGENVTTINPYENLDAFQQASRFDESGNRDENMTSQDDEGREDTPPPSSEMDCSSSSPARPLSSRAGTPDDLTEEYNHEDDAPPSFNDNDDEVQEVEKKDVSDTLEAPPAVVEPILKTPPRSSGETSSVCPLDLSHPRNERLTKSGGNPPSSSRRRKGPAFKLTRISVQIDDEHLDGDDESENYPPSIKISQGTCSTPSGDRKPETVPSSSSRMTSPFKEINKATSASLMTSDETSGRVEHSEYNQQPVAVSNRLVVEKQSPTSSSRDNPRAMGEPSWKLGQVYKCNDCEISFGDCVMYTVHMGYHDYQNPFKCNMCGEESKDKVEFFLHIARTPHLYN